MTSLIIIGMETQPCLSLFFLIKCDVTFQCSSHQVLRSSSTRAHINVINVLDHLCYYASYPWSLRERNLCIQLLVSHLKDAPEFWAENWLVLEICFPKIKFVEHSKRLGKDISLMGDLGERSIDETISFNICKMPREHRCGGNLLCDLTLNMVLLQRKFTKDSRWYRVDI